MGEGLCVTYGTVMECSISNQESLCVHWVVIQPIPISKVSGKQKRARIKNLLRDMVANFFSDACISLLPNNFADQDSILFARCYQHV